MDSAERSIPTVEVAKMKINIQGLEVIVDSVEELQQLIDHFGSADASEKSPKKANGSPTGNGGSGGNGGSVVHDRVILQHLVEAADTGVHTNTLGDMLGRKGKSVGPALLQWGVKIKLVAEETNNPFEKARPNGGRGWKLKSTMLPIAKQMLDEMK